MKKIFSIKGLIFLGLLLFFTAFIPLTQFGVNKAYASSIEKEKKEDYRLNLKSIPLVKGKSFTLRVYNVSENAKVSFKSANTEIASVNNDGTIVANNVGFTTITATIEDGENQTPLTCDVTVGPPAFSVKMTRSRIILGLDNSDQLRVILKPSNTTEVARFSSYNSSIASVSTGGRVIAKNIGLTYLFAEIDATNLDGSRKFAACTVIVTRPEDAPLLENYFSDHPEMSLISEADLLSALNEFFNKASEVAPTVTPTAEATSKSLVEALDQFLNEKFDLAAKRKAWDEAIAKAMANQAEVIIDSTAK
ncbi:Ig-like domain-containing protein [Mobilitalea sibirica]|uniref:Ig-like domain-containing protein n=1 Tax=Mobilitalea sibirica TaxID=1462919 RepID=A0A8J7H4Z9_9FIRM|nr:Ig-like domain-containing protein [Mobilitalea sibirica]MBH1941564.1 Ig-like domain-containing protein [Mobilitalea sibirica]